MGVPQHVIPCGNDRQIYFVGEEGLATYAHWQTVFSVKIVFYPR